MTDIKEQQREPERAPGRRPLFGRPLNENGGIEFRCGPNEILEGRLSMPVTVTWWGPRAVAFVPVVPAGDR